MAALTELQKKQIQQAEELLFSGPNKEGFAKDLFVGRFREESIFPFPEFTDEELRIGNHAVAAVREFCKTGIDADLIDPWLQVGRQESAVDRRMPGRLQPAVLKPVFVGEVPEVLVSVDHFINWRVPARRDESPDGCISSTGGSRRAGTRLRLFACLSQKLQ